MVALPTYKLLAAVLEDTGPQQLYKRHSRAVC